ncbi:hypothetical protein L1887_51559 [Cichorium endivia]|nr:hypothetical protein L1887_51559 [Cichorium endivia]
MTLLGVLILRLGCGKTVARAGRRKGSTESPYSFARSGLGVVNVARAAVQLAPNAHVRSLGSGASTSVTHC